MNRHVLITIVLALAVHVGAVTSQAAPIAAGFPAPGGTTFSSTGLNLVDSPGRTRIYSGFDTSAWSILYWQITTGFIGDLTFDTALAASATPSISGNQITWSFSDQWNIATAFGTVTTSATLRTRFYQMDGVTPLLASDFVSLGAGYPQTMLEITAADLAAWGGGFQVNQLFMVGGMDAADYYNSLATSGGFNSTTNAGFWYEPAAVPEPTTLTLLGAGLAAGARKLRKRAKQGRR